MMLERLGIPFQRWSPDIDESLAEGETGFELVTRLAALKADAAAAEFPDALVIGSDQVAVCGGRIVGKPRTTSRAQAQLGSFSGQTVEFLSAVSFRCLETGFRMDRVVPTLVSFRQLSEAEISRYIEKDRPLQCAGSFKSEAAGISLLRSMVSDDPTAIVGLPLIATSEALRQAGFAAP
jgi:septum formation protein